MNYYHYTDINGLKGILENKEIWLTDTRFLNDESEGLDFLNLLKTHKNRTKFGIDIFNIIKSNMFDENSINCYVASFCKERDLLSMWKGYCKTNNSYCIGFNNIIQVSFLCDGGNISYWSGKKYLFDCIYSDDDKINIINDIIKSVLQLSGHEKTYVISNFFRIMMLAWKYKAIFKNKGFYEEKEVRVILQNFKDDNFIPFFRDRNISGNISSVPYIKMKFSPEIIDEIIIGPTANPGLAEIGLEEFKRSLGPEYAHIKIRHSSIPYRAL